MDEIIDERINVQPLSPGDFDALMAKGWRLLGFSIVRHNYGINHEDLCRTIPLRIRLDFSPTLSHSQRKLLRRNAHLKVRFGPIHITEEKHELFQRHTQRFRSSIPDSIFCFLHPNTNLPVPGIELCVYEGDRLFACSYMHLGKKAASATYCFFDPAFAHYRPGIFTMLLEMEWARQSGKKFYYHGYCYDEPSQFDYKLNFHNLEYMNWKTGLWLPLHRIWQRSPNDIPL